jgi:two-component system, OmpR family, sensor histidine kinase SenX3
MSASSSSRRRSIIFFISLGVCLVVIAVALNVSWIVVLNWARFGVLYFIGLLFFLAIIAGLVLNTIFLVREIRRNEQHDTFINAMTHELKTPIASIRLYLETLQRRELEPEKRQEFYNIMLEDSDRLLQTIEQVLRAGRVGRSSHLYHRTEVDLGDLVQECVDLARTRNHLPPECITFTAKDKPLLVHGEPEELRGAVLNLLDNAIKYSPDRIEIHVRVIRQNAKTAVVEVSDSGIGIEPSELKHVFKRFYRVPGKVMIRVKGTGLGLFIVRSVAEKHGGKVTVESPGPGLGSTFRLSLPAAAVPADAR